MKGIGVVDYGCGNIQSVIRMLEKAESPSYRVSTPSEVHAARALILPGVGAFDHGISALRGRNLESALGDVAGAGHIPILGICLGMQLMCVGSDEGNMPGLGWFNARASRFIGSDHPRLPVPHMGWNTIRVVRESALLPSMSSQRFYFVHSYKIHCNDPDDIVATCDYGGDFVAAFSKKNLFGVQFHPEKSHRFGLALMRRFIAFVDGVHAAA